MKIKVYNLISESRHGVDVDSYGTREAAEAAFILAVKQFYVEDTSVDTTYAEAEALYKEDEDWDNLEIYEAEIDLTPKPPSEGLKRFYVVKAWDNFPEGGTCGEVLWARDEDHAEELMVETMVGYREEGEDVDEATIRDQYADEWHTIDCWPLDDFIERQLISPSDK